MSYESIRKLHFKTYRITDYCDLIGMITGKKEGFEDIREKFIFRGVSNKDYELTPSSLRGNNYYFENINQYICADFKFMRQMSVNEAIKKGILKNIDDEFKNGFIIPKIDANGNFINDDCKYVIYSEMELQIKRELYVLLKFLNQTDKTGLKITTTPKVRRNIHNYLSYEPTLWPDEDFLEIISLAQHYGLLTRALDWSYDFKTALYFAVKDILTDNPTDGALWAFNYKIFEDNYDKNNIYGNRLLFYRPEYNNNPNLTAQKGLFTFIIDDIETELENKPLDQLIFEKMCKSDENREIFIEEYKLIPFNLPNDKTLFYKFEIPKEIKLDILNQLYLEGYSEDYLYPGYVGIVLNMKNRKILEEKLIEKRNSTKL